MEKLRRYIGEHTAQHFNSSSRNTGREREDGILMSKHNKEKPQQTFTFIISLTLSTPEFSSHSEQSRKIHILCSSPLSKQLMQFSTALHKKRLRSSVRAWMAHSSSSSSRWTFTVYLCEQTLLTNCLLTNLRPSLLLLLTNLTFC